MIWDATNTPNFLACAQALQAGGFNVQVTDLSFNGGAYQSVCAYGEVEVHLLNKVPGMVADCGYVDPDELLANAQTLRTKNEEVHQRQMVVSVRRVSELMGNRDVQSAIQAAGFQDQGYWQVLPKVLAISQMSLLRTAIEMNVAQ